MAELLFCVSIFLTFHAYIGYPLSLYLLGFYVKKQIKKAPIFPPVSLIITAYNEEKRIESKLQNALCLEYPRDKLQIIVASDASTDRTNEITGHYAGQGIELLSINERRGKENAQREAVLHATGEILAFTDVATLLEPESLKKIVSNFADPSVGCVSSEDRMLSGTGESIYVKYEMLLRRLESAANSLVGLSGSFFAARKEVCRDFSPVMQSDFRTVLNSVGMGLRAISDPEVVGIYDDIKSEGREFDRKVRTVVRGLTVFFNHLEFLNVFRYGLFSYQYFCHKLLRWLVPFLLILAVFANLALALSSVVMSIILVFHFSFYIAGVFAWKRNVQGGPLTKIPKYFLIANSSILVAWMKYLSGQRIVMWKPSER